MWDEFKSKSAEEVLKDVLRAANERVMKSGKDIEYSGVMATIAYYGNRNLVFCTIGECKAAWIAKLTSAASREKVDGVLAELGLKCAGRDESGRELYELTPDHTWTNEREANRARESGCIIEQACLENVGTLGRAAVWTNSMHHEPGLFTSRIMGFTTAASCGVLCEPETKRYALKDLKDMEIHAILVGTSGFWSVENASEILRLAGKSRPDARVTSFIDAQKLSSNLLRAATIHWEEQFADSDMQVQCFFPFMFESEGKVTYELESLGARN